MWNLLLDLLRKMDLEIQNRFVQLQTRYGRTRATLVLLLIGAGLGATAMFYVYLVIAFILSLQIRTQDPILVILFLALYVLLGTVHGLWLGAACGATAAFRAQQKRSEAAIACWVGSLPYLLLLTGAYLYADETTLPISALLFLCGLPLLWAVVLTFVGVRLICTS